MKPSKSPSDRKVAVATDKYGLSGMSENLSIVERMTVTIRSKKPDLLSDRRPPLFSSMDDKCRLQQFLRTAISKGRINGSLAEVVDFPVGASMVISKQKDRLCSVFAAVTLMKLQVNHG